MSSGTTTVDPKYAQLPGIAVDQPDLYESSGSGLPEADQDWLNTQGDTSDSVELLHMSTKEAFGQFQGKFLDGKSVDFSDRLKNKKYRQGYLAWSGDIEVYNRGYDETPLQKYQRLNCEVRELIEELETAQEEDKEKKEQANLSDLVGRVTGLSQELTSLNLEDRIGSDMLASLKDPEGTASAKLLAQLQALQSGPTPGQTSKTDGEAGLSGNESVIYELLMKPDTAKLEHLKRISLLDRRLEALEKAIGVNPERMSTLSVETNQKSILGAIQVLSSRTALLDPGHLDHIEGRLAALQHKMNAIAERKPILADQEKLSKIDELYDLVHRSVGQKQMLEEVVGRLESLQELHSRAQNFDKALSELEEVQSKIEVGLSNNQVLLKASQKTFADNLSNIQENFKVLDAKLDKLKKK